MSGNPGNAVKALLKKHPKARKIIVCDNLRAVNSLLKAHGLQVF